MKVIIAGSGITVYFLAKRFISKGYTLSIISGDQDDCDYYSRYLKALVIKGDSTDPEILAQADVHSAHILIGMTSRDQDNLAVCQLAKLYYKVPRILAVVNDPDNEEVFLKLGIKAVSSCNFLIQSLDSLTVLDEIKQQISVVEGKGYLIKPHVITSARIVMILYLGYLIYGFIAYLIFGMNPFDALLHCFTAISTGGFGNYGTSIGYFNSPPIEIITITLMILGNLNFLTAYLMTKQKWYYVFRNGEVKIFALLLAIAIPLVYLFTAASLYSGLGKQLRIAVFETVSALTTTGFSLTNYNNPLWSDASILILILLMLVGGGACSTAGGLKQYRVYLMLKSIFWQIRKSILPRNAVTSNYVWEGEQKEYVNDSKLLSTSNFVVLYMFTYALGVLIIAGSIDPATGMHYSLRNAMFEFASSLGTVGLSVGVTSLSTPTHIIWLQTAAMLLGRLEFFVVFIALAKGWRDIGKAFGSLFKGSR